MWEEWTAAGSRRAEEKQCRNCEMHGVSPDTSPSFMVLVTDVVLVCVLIKSWFGAFIWPCIGLSKLCVMF